MTARANKEPAVIRAKHARLGEPHISPLVALADEIAASRGLQPGDVPYPDPEFTGTTARALVLLESPGPKTDARKGSGLLSIENDDPSAERVHQEYAKVGLNWRQLLHWNVVPWPMDGRRKPSAADHREAGPWLVRLLDLLPDLRAVFLLGKVAENGWSRASGLLPTRVRTLPLILGPHPSKLGLTRPGARERLTGAVAALAEVLR